MVNYLNLNWIYLYPFEKNISGFYFIFFTFEHPWILCMFLSKVKHKI